MNQESSYEKLIAQKLQDLQMPDMESSWQQMKLLLDQEMPEIPVVPPSFAVRNAKKIFGGLVTLLALLTLVWLGTDNKSDHSTPTFAGEDDKISKSGFSPKNTDIAPKELLSDNQPGGSTETLGPATQNGDPQQDRQASHLQAFPESLPKGKGIATAPPNRTLPKMNARDHHQEWTKKNTPGKQLILPVSNLPANTDLPETIVAFQSRAVTQTESDTALVTNGMASSAPTAVANHTLPAPYRQPGQIDVQGAVLPVEIPVFQEQKGVDFPLASVPHETNLSDNRQQLLFIAENDDQHSIEVPASIHRLPDVEKQRKAILKQMERAEKRHQRELAKSYRSEGRTFWGASTDRWFAAGLAPYQNFSLGSQQTYGYNASGNRGVAADYIPAPYLQFHLTDRVYLLSEFQFNAPQSTPSLLLSQKTNTTPGAVWTTENTYLRKMYYFNMPLSFYYSPVKNVYFGSGLQFSSFNSGLAYREQLAANNAVLYSQVMKIREDSLSSSIRSSEWRYLLDANYYVDRFMFGFRYNQALSPYINLKPSPTLSNVQSRNQAFQFYIRYNIIVSKKK